MILSCTYKSVFTLNVQVYFDTIQKIRLIDDTVLIINNYLPFAIVGERSHGYDVLYVQTIIVMLL